MRSKLSGDTNTTVHLSTVSTHPSLLTAVKVIQPYRVVSTNGTAQVQCFLQPRPSYHQSEPSHDHTLPYPYPDPEDLRVSLLKGLNGTQKFCSCSLNLGLTKADVKKEGEVLCYAQVREGAVEVTVSGLKATDTDVYHCEIEVFYPPPYLKFTGNGTLIHVLDSSECPVPEAQRQITHQGDDESDESYETMAPVSVPVIVLLTLVMFVLIIMIYVQTLQCERGRREIASLFHKADAAAFSCDNIA
ncbi:cytotoxic T-lymphocyte protein 4 isoform X1 [Thunnus albacares]|uniref:cytotoxic T-lymphocyte protein 4 isoform X1 n=1 Tax=Thunnus albacares TaxID=8236 RepID=UPI001CF64B55|nr:cytotoxic T-lymphocyte protein 4 isoform X1 [Thunnus albacares]